MNLVRIIQSFRSLAKSRKSGKKQLLIAASQPGVDIPMTDGFCRPPVRMPETKEPYVPPEEVRRRCFYSRENAPAGFYCGKISGSSLPYFSSCAECFFHPSTPFLHYIRFFRGERTEKKEN